MSDDEQLMSLPSRAFFYLIAGEVARLEENRRYEFMGRLGSEIAGLSEEGRIAQLSGEGEKEEFMKEILRLFAEFAQFVNITHDRFQ